jgi:hypothetical protein
MSYKNRNIYKNIIHIFISILILTGYFYTIQSSIRNIILSQEGILSLLASYYLVALSLSTLTCRRVAGGPGSSSLLPKVWWHFGGSCLILPLAAAVAVAAPRYAAPALTLLLMPTAYSRKSP